jgi:hypothetical protein
MGGNLYFWLGASADADRALAVPVEPRLDPSGFDPSRCTHPQWTTILRPLGGTYAACCTVCGALK